MTRKTPRQRRAATRAQRENARKNAAWRAAYQAQPIPDRDPPYSRIYSIVEIARIFAVPPRLLDWPGDFKR